MEITKTKLEGVYVIEPRVFGDNRGWFMETYSKKDLSQINVEFVQDNHSYSGRKGVLRGIHFQNYPHSQSKLVRCVSGSIMDFAVDLRKNSITYRQWIKEELSADNKRMLYLPKGFGHAFIALTDNVEIIYKVDDYYYPELDRSIRYDDPAIGIDWEIKYPIMSAKDENAPLLFDSDCNL